MDRTHSLALLEVANLTPALIIADRCLKAAGVTLLGIESTDSVLHDHPAARRWHDQRSLTVLWERPRLIW